MKKKVGFIGMGTMGSRMAQQLLKNGHSLTVFNRDKNKTKPLVKMGAQAANTISALVKAVDYICVSVSDDKAIKDVISKATEIDRSGKLFISLSTISPDMAEELDEMISRKNAYFLDAPVSGSAPQVESAQLVIFVGGKEPKYIDAESIFSSMSKQTYYMGKAGNGSRMKLVTNTLLGIGVQAIAEALLLGQRMGMSKTKLIEVLSDTAVVSPSQKAKMQNALTDKYEVAFSLANMYKDFGLILGQAKNTFTPMPATVAANQISAMGMARKLDTDFSVVIRILEESTGNAKK